MGTSSLCRTKISVPIVGLTFVKGRMLEHATRLDLVQLAAFVRSLDGSHAASNVAWLSSLRQQAKRLFASRA
eukprot:1138948-Pelagomonas_calceolata.AAC.2